MRSPPGVLAIPFIGHADYGLTNDIVVVIAAIVTFATPYAIFVFRQYGTSFPIELDEAARIDGASPFPGVLEDLPAADGAGAGRGGDLRLLLASNQYLYRSCCCLRSTA